MARLELLRRCTLPDIMMNLFTCTMDLQDDTDGSKSFNSSDARAVVWSTEHVRVVALHSRPGKLSAQIP